MRTLCPTSPTKPKPFKHHSTTATSWKAGDPIVFAPTTADKGQSPRSPARDKGKEKLCGREWVPGDPIVFSTTSTLDGVTTRVGSDETGKKRKEGPKDSPS